MAFTERQKEINAMSNHFEKWDLIANEFGIGYLKRLVPIGKQTLIDCYTVGDIHFNDGTHLWQWDSMHVFISPTMRKINGWGTLSDTVCILKHVAQYYIVGADKPE